MPALSVIKQAFLKMGNVMRGGRKSSTRVLATQGAGLADCLAGIESDRIGQVGGTFDIPQGQVGMLADFQRADLVLQSERTGRIGRRAKQRFLRRQAPQGARMFIASSREVMGEVPGLQSVDTAIGTPASRNAATGGCTVSRRK